MKEISVSVSEGVLSRLEEYSSQCGLSQSDVVSEAISNYLNEIEEDKEDLDDAIRIAAEIDTGRMKTYTLSEVVTELGL